MCQNLRKHLQDEQDRIAQLKKEIDTLNERAIDANKIIERNDEIIKKQRCEIGIKKEIVFTDLDNWKYDGNFVVFFRGIHLKDLFTRHGWCSTRICL